MYYYQNLSLQDIQRYKSDKELNTRKTQILDQHSQGSPFHERKWADVRVGDIVMVKKDTEFPADMILIHAEKTKDIVYVDTMNLDGETNLKEKIVFTKDFTLQRIEKELNGEVVCDQPNESLDDWDGNIHFNGNLLNCR